MVHPGVTRGRAGGCGCGRLTRHWDVVASYAYTDVSYTRSDTLQGERLMGVPRHGASLWSSYRFGGSGWKAGAGVIARSSIC